LLKKRANPVFLVFMKELEIWQFAAERLKRGEPLMLLVVAESSGQQPGQARV
jgi:hypothetical protein